jgi:hypothetical protein
MKQISSIEFNPVFHLQQQRRLLLLRLLYRQQPPLLLQLHYLFELVRLNI